MTPASPPCHDELEADFIGDTVFGRNRHRIEEISGIIKPGHLHKAIHREVWRRAVECATAPIPVPITPVTIARLIATPGSLHYEQVSEDVALLAGRQMNLHANAYLAPLRAIAARRKLMGFAAELTDLTQDDRAGWRESDYFAAAEKALYDLTDAEDGHTEFVPITTALDEGMARIEKAYKNKGRLTGVPTGLASIDSRIGGFQAGDLVVLAGRPSMGKTALALNVTRNAAEVGKSVAFFSMEMALDELTMRYFAQETAIDTGAMRRGVATEDFPRLEEARARLARLPIVFQRGSSLTPTRIRSALRRQKKRNGIDMAVIDYLGLMDTENPSAQRVTQVDEICKALKQTAMELDIVVVLLCQLSRAVENREDKRPMLSDLRESGGIEAAADIVMFVYRHEYYVERETPAPDKEAEWHRRLDACRGRGEVATAKFRQGKVGVDHLAWDAGRQEFRELDQWGR
jgi:replicative DNA helicase